MKIYLTVGRGDGPTPLAAFDNAMYDAHVGNYNLIHLSSVIPPYSNIVQAPFVGEPKDYGDRLYVVQASQTETTPGKWAWAGLVHVGLNPPSNVVGLEQALSSTRSV